MKKFLSLVLALTMAMSLVTISAGAKDFTDDSKITYKEAVDVVSSLDIVDGYTDGSFRPDDIRDKLAAAERFARNNGQVVVVAEPKPVVVLEIRRWLDSFSPQLSYDEMRAQNIAMPERPFAPVPLSNTVIE